LNLFSYLNDVDSDKNRKINSKIEKLKKIDWNFTNAITNMDTHRYHPYFAKFIPQIPHNLIKVLSEPGDTILDPFCGSGTALVEANFLDRNAIGIDLNPLACLISKVKTTPINIGEIKKIKPFLDKLQIDFDIFYGQKRLLEEKNVLNKRDLDFSYPNINHWFRDFIQKELMIIKKRILQIENNVLKNFLLMCFSSIIILVSNQDSETRYCYREKSLEKYDTLKLFRRKLKSTIPLVKAYNKKHNPNRFIRVYSRDARNLEFIDEESIDLIVTSPPYINAYDYHLYHKHRLLWLDMDPVEFKKNELGAHAKFSRKKVEDGTEFFNNMKQVMNEMKRVLIPGGFACIIVGNSIIKGKNIMTNEELKAISPLIYIDDIIRTIDLKKKAFNPKIGNIKKEHILIFQKK